jgi:hypothetical protein
MESDLTLGALMRRFVRHPAHIPIEIDGVSPLLESHDDCSMNDVSQGGLSCTLDHPLALHSLVCVHIPSVCPEYKGKGEVVWCHKNDEGYDIGIRFSNTQEAFKSRMVQQICQIEHYKNIIFEKEGRVLDEDQAAEEWIQKHAADFPG